MAEEKYAKLTLEQAVQGLTERDAEIASLKEENTAQANLLKEAMDDISSKTGSTETIVKVAKVNHKLVTPSFYHKVGEKVEKFTAKEVKKASKELLAEFVKFGNLVPVEVAAKTEE